MIDCVLQYKSAFIVCSKVFRYAGCSHQSRQRTLGVLETLTSMVPATMYLMGFTTRHCSNQLGSKISIASSVTCKITVFPLDTLLDSNSGTEHSLAMTQYLSYCNF